MNASMTQEEKNRLIGALILKGVSDGMDVRSAFDMVLGAGSYDRFASDLYDHLKASDRK